MNKDKDQIMISIGGFGGCNLSEALKKIGYSRSPYDWNLTYQSAVIDSILNLTPLFVFDKKYYSDAPSSIHKVLKNEKNTALDMHYFHNDYETDVDKIKEMYDRRLKRLSENLNSNVNKILVRRIHSDSGHPGIEGNKEMDCIEKWINFYNIIKQKYTNIKLLLISNEYEYSFKKSLCEGALLINDADIFDNKEQKLFYELKETFYDEIL